MPLSRAYVCTNNIFRLAQQWESCSVLLMLAFTFPGGGIGGQTIYRAHGDILARRYLFLPCHPLTKALFTVAVFATITTKREIMYMEEFRNASMPYVATLFAYLSHIMCLLASIRERSTYLGTCDSHQLRTHLFSMLLSCMPTCWYTNALPCLRAVAVIYDVLWVCSSRMPMPADSSFRP